MSRRGGSGAQRSEESAFGRRYAALWNLNSFHGPRQSLSWAAIMLPEAGGVGVRCCPVEPSGLSLGSRHGDRPRPQGLVVGQFDAVAASLSRQMAA